MLLSEEYRYFDGDQPLLGYLSYDRMIDEPRPAVIVIHDWSGRNQFACEQADHLAKLGYVAFALDMFGGGLVAASNEEKQTLIEPFLTDRSKLLQRVNAAYNVVRELRQVNRRYIAVIGFCFGGLCALDLARSGADICAAVSFHGLLDGSNLVAAKPISAKLLVLHGYEDPMVSEQQLSNFYDEMTTAGVDWQIHMYGKTLHAFTNPAANDYQLGTVFNELAARRSWQAMTSFLQEVFL
ncbi:MAG: dienelactone hydrolase family protein [Legionella sp.]